MASASTGMPRGSPEHPTALLELFPAGPKTSMRRFASPLTTGGCLVYSSVQFTNPAHLDDAEHVVQAAELLSHGGEHGESDDARRLDGVLVGDVVAALTDDARAVWVSGHLAGRTRGRPRALRGRRPRRGWWRRGRRARDRAARRAPRGCRRGARTVARGAPRSPGTPPRGRSDDDRREGARGGGFGGVASPTLGTATVADGAEGARRRR